MRVINNQNAVCTGDSSRLHPTAIGRIEPPIHWQRAACLSFVLFFHDKIDWWQ
ncbi:hypothetical protein [Bacillus subtilis]|uniref:hypothetical protein n=1 Tax=Bacillus subtilis TaxID=1423 RepID=UPI001C240771|nr:hypothetical protein [Bacillus subtilis]MBU8710461.1 hypothetical protein [Bacillus subtilis]